MKTNHTNRVRCSFISSFCVCSVPEQKPHTPCPPTFRDDLLQRNAGWIERGIIRVSNRRMADSLASKIQQIQSRYPHWKREAIHDALIQADSNVGKAMLQLMLDGLFEFQFGSLPGALIEKLHNVILHRF